VFVSAPNIEANAPNLAVSASIDVASALNKLIYELIEVIYVQNEALSPTEEAAELFVYPSHIHQKKAVEKALLSRQPRTNYRRKLG